MKLKVHIVVVCLSNLTFYRLTLHFCHQNLLNHKNNNNNKLNNMNIKYNLILEENETDDWNLKVCNMVVCFI